MSRREFLAAVSSAAALVALEGCSSSSSRGTTRPARTSSTTTPPTSTTSVPRVAGRRPDLTRAAGTDLIPEIEHIVVVMQENHSYDSYFGMLGPGRRLHARRARRADRLAIPTRTAIRCGRSTWPTPARRTRVSQNWNSSHIQWNNGALDGFVRSPSGAAAMGYWDGTDLPFYYGLAKTFPLCDRWFASCARPDVPEPPVPAVRLGARQRQHDRRPERRTRAEERHDRRGAQPPRHLVARLQHDAARRCSCSRPCSGSNDDKCPKIDQFFTDAAAGKLPSFCFVESNGETSVGGSPAGHLAWARRSPPRS